MSFHRVAFGKGTNQRGTTRYIGLYKHEAGTDQNKEFYLGPNGYKLTYNYPSAQSLQPGITSTELEVTMIWDDVTALETILSDIATGPEGKYFIGIHSSESSRIPYVGTFFVILPESMSIADEFDNVEVTFRGTDGLSLLRNVDYNNDGQPYTDHQTILQHIKNVQEKHILWDVYEEVAPSTFGRVQIRENIVSVDDELYSAYPPSTNSGTPTRTRVHHRTFHKQGQDGVNEYFSAYDVLESICLTFNWQLQLYTLGFWFNPIFNDIASLYSRIYRYNGGELVGSNNEYYNYFNGQGTFFSQDLVNEVSVDNRKGASWIRTFAAPAGDVRLVRNTQGDQGVIYGVDVSPNDQLFDANEVYEPGDIVKIRGSVRFINDNDYTFDGPNRLFRIIPAFEITLTDVNDDTVYFNNTVTTLESTLTVSLQSSSFYSDNVNFQDQSVSEGSWSTDAGTYSYKAFNNTSPSFVHDANQNFDRTVDFDFDVELRPNGFNTKDLTITPKIVAYNYQGNVDTTYASNLDAAFISVGAFRIENGEVQAVSQFTHRAHTDTGRTEINLGTTLIGDRGAKTYFGGIEVYNGTDWVASSGWVTQDQSTPRTINQIVVEEVCAFHKRVKQIQAGSIVNGKDYTFGDALAFKDIATNFVYAPLAYTRNFTAAIDEVSLVLVGRNLLDITATQEGKGTDAVTTYAKPNNNDAVANVWGVSNNLGGLSQTYHNEARFFFGQDWSSVIGAGETKEQYIIYNTNGQGEFTDFQGESPAAGTNIQRRIYRNGNARTGASDSGWSAIGSSAQPNAGVTLAGVIDLIHEYEAKNTGGRASYLITYSEVSTALLLDTYTEATAAYSLRKVRSDYIGGPIVVRRSSDNATASVGFTSDGDLDTAALLSFCGSGDGFVQTWYDQAGSNSLIQNSTSAQPQIVASGQVVTVNSHPAVDFNGTSHYMDKANVTLNPSSNDVLTFAGVFQLDSVSSSQYIAAQWDGTTSNQVFGLINLSTAQIRFQARFQNGTLSTVLTGSGTTAVNTQYIGVGQFKQNHSKGVLNDTDYTHTNLNSTVNHATSDFALGHRPDSGVGKFNGKLQELCVWSQATNTHDRNDLSDAIDSHYGVY